MQHPVSRHDRGVAPTGHRFGHGLTIRSYEARADGIAEHFCVRLDIRGAPLSEDKTLGLDPRPIRLRQRGTFLQRRYHSFVILRCEACGALHRWTSLEGWQKTVLEAILRGLRCAQPPQDDGGVSGERGR